MTLAELKRLLEDLENAEGFGPDTEVFIDDPTRGLQEPVLYTEERFRDGPHVIIIEAPKDTVDQVS